MKQLIVLIVFSTLFITIQAQTPKIAHKSHSGISETFTIDYLNNFGLPPDYEKYIKKKVVKKQEAKKSKESEYLKTKEIEPLSIETKIKPVKIQQKVKDENKIKSNPSSKRTNKKKKQKTKNRFTIKKAVVTNTDYSSNYLNWLWVALLGIIILVGILPVKKS
jgi:uncharacterized protein (UPF0332 family)